MDSHWLQKPRVCVGVMTGTSVDAVDVCMATFTMGSRPVIDNVVGVSSAFAGDERSLLQTIMQAPQHISVINDAHTWLSHRVAAVVNGLCAARSMDTKDIDVVGFHGQTVWHEPHDHDVAGITMKATLQLGSGTTLASLLGCAVVSDFRAADMALGGQGAPLVPRFDADFLSSADENIIALNIGGMANVTIMPEGSDVQAVRAFDTGPGNVWIDAVMQSLYSQPYDNNGERAFSGALDEDLFLRLQALEYVIAVPPKSTGREYFSQQLLNELLGDESRKPEDVVHTMSCYTAWSIAENVRRYAWEKATIVVSGGGCRNPFLMNALRRELPAARIVTSDERGISSQWKECLCFAYLAYRTMAGLPSGMPSVTGASRSAILGSVSQV